MTLHLLAMNVASAGPLYCIWLSRQASESEVHFQVGRILAWWSVAGLLVGILTGTGLLLMQSETLAVMTERFPARALWFAGMELVFSLLCLSIYAASWQWRKGPRWLLALVALMSVANLLYHFPPLMTVLGKLTANKNWTQDTLIERSEYVALMLRSDIASFTFHFFVASLAVSAVAVLAILQSRQISQTASVEARNPIARRAGLAALVATLIQFPVGLWVLVSLPSTTRGALIGEHLLASLTFIASLFLVLMLLQRLAMLVLGEITRQNLLQCVYLMVVVVLLMTTSLRLSRYAGESRQSPITQNSPEAFLSRAE